MAELLVDTDIVVDHLRGAKRMSHGRSGISYSVITRCELFAGSGGDEGSISRLLAAFRELEVDRAVAERAGRIRRDTGVRTPDALIAATALEHGLALITRNKKDFQGVRGLRLTSPP